MNELHLGREPEYPFLTTQEIVDMADRRVVDCDSLGTATPITDWIIAENAKRLEAYEAWRSAPVDCEGGPLIYGMFYDVTIEGDRRWGGASGKPKTWRMCRYLGRSTQRQYGNTFDRLDFGRWGAMAAKDKWAHEKLGGFVPTKLVSVAKVIPAPSILAKLEGKPGR
jgi:hypothetical protein